MGIKLLFKKLDFFKLPAEMYLHRRDRKTNIKNHYYWLGTTLGGIVSLFICAALLSYFVILWINMYSTAEDMITSQTRVNPFEDGYDYIKIQNFSFLPNIHIKQISEGNHTEKYGVRDSDFKIDTSTLK